MRRKVAGWGSLLTVAAMLAIFTNGGGNLNPTPTATPTPTPSGGSANVWVVPGTCDSTPTREATPDPLADIPAGAKACTVQQAWDAVDDGDTIRVDCGSYGWQGATGTKSSETWVIGEPGCVTFTGTHECEAVFGAFSVFCVLDTANLTLENVTLDSDTTFGLSSCFRIPDGSTPVTFRNVKCHGDGPFVAVNAPDFTWDGGEIGGDDDGLPRITCTSGGGEPLWLFAGADGAFIHDVRIRKRLIQVTPTPNVGGCGSDGIPHLEGVRGDGDVDDVTLSGVRIDTGSDMGSGSIFVNSNPSGWTIVNSFFGEIIGSFNVQAGSAGGWTWLYNTFSQGLVLGDDSGTWVGNVGPIPGCSGTHSNNIRPGTGSCTGDTYVGATDLGIDDEGHLESGSPAIDAGETPGASDYCTGGIVGSVDFDGDLRPVGVACDAGADEGT